ncbi:AraC family transcriptional regulator [Blautia sp. AF22-5LB]|nr:AraC family transcriptional regulator [Blautia sp. AF22-5LB]
MNQTSQQPSLKEKQSHGTRLFPCAYYHFFNPGLRLRVRHHWHEEIEIIYLHHGSFKLDINMEPYGTDRECFLFINSGELHSLRSLSIEFDEQAVVFSPSMLLFQDYDSIDESILLPLTQNKLTFPRFLDQTSPFFSAFRSSYQQISHIFSRSKENLLAGEQILTDDVISQLQIKAGLLQLIGILMDAGLMCQSSRTESQKITAIKTVLSYIADHYHEKLYVQDLASQVNMNGQYFCRFFKRSIGKTPIDYINDYRLNKVIRLLETGDAPVTEICLECGFNNMGNFQRLFKRKTGITPLQYRKLYLSKKSE